MQLVNDVSLLEIILLTGLITLAVWTVIDKRKLRKEAEKREEAYSRISTRQIEMAQSLASISSSVNAVKNLLQIKVPDSAQTLLVRKRNGIKIEDTHIHPDIEGR